MGDAYMRYGNAARAAGAFRNAQRYHYTDSLTLLYLGNMLRLQGDYKEAAKAYTAFLDSVPDSEEARCGLKSCSGALGIKEKGSAYSVKNVLAL